MSERTTITIMLARKVRIMRGEGHTNAQIAKALDISIRSVSNALAGRGMSQQLASADRAEVMFGGVLGPGTGNYRRHAVNHIDGGSSQYHDIGVHERSSPDPLAILMAIEEVADD